MQNTNQNQNYEGALSWDSTIEQESSFVLLEPGEYNFVVKNMSRATYTPGPNSKITDSSPMAELELDVTDSKGQSATVKENLILHTALEWKISQFFISIGQKVKGQPFVPNWGAIVGATGRAEFDQRKYTSNGEEKQVNQVKNFLEPVQNATQPQYNAPTQVAPAPTQQPAPQAVAQPNAQPKQGQPQANPGFNF